MVCHAILIPLTGCKEGQRLVGIKLSCDVTLARLWWCDL